MDTKNYIKHYLYIDEDCGKVIESEDNDLDILCCNCGKDLVQKGTRRIKV
jgi:predicted RNA-binding Zn-ribbon protein involved in translation (DUF1610 family)